MGVFTGNTTQLFALFGFVTVVWAFLDQAFLLSVAAAAAFVVLPLLVLVLGGALGRRFPSPGRRTTR